MLADHAWCRRNGRRARIDAKLPERMVYLAVSMPSDIDLALAPLFGKPCWGVKQGYSTYLTFEFGQPHLEIREPKQPRAKSARVRRLFARRRVSVYGEWRLWLYICNWALFQGERCRATANSTRRQTLAATNDIDGQAITDVQVTPDLRHATFSFDLGGRLEVSTWHDNSEDVQWLLYEPSGRTLEVRADGHYLYARPGEEGQWRLPAPS